LSTASEGTIPISDWKKFVRTRFRSSRICNGKGTSTDVNRYSFGDREVTGKLVYRLGQIDFNGEFGYSEVIELGSIVADFALDQNYPNPFNPSTTISFAIPAKSFVTLKVYNVLGKEVANLVNGEFESGRHSVDFNASDLASGVYYYTVSAGSYTSTKKMILMK